MASRRESMLMIRITRLPEYTPVTGGDGAGAVELLDDDRAEDALIIAQKTLTTPKRHRKSRSRISTALPIG